MKKRKKERKKKKKKCCWKLEPFYLFISEKYCNTIGAKIRKLTALKDSDYIWFQSQKNSWRQELLHSRIIGAERVKETLLPNKSCQTDRERKKEEKKKEKNNNQDSI